jgi:hypothetical protein
MCECCETCRYFCEVKKRPFYQEVLTHICVLHLIEDHADYILEVTKNDVCECWTE